MNRYPDWEVRLVDYLGQIARSPFAYGRNDCALFTAGAIRAMTGEDLARGYRGYRSLKAGHKLLRERGFDDHVALAASLLTEVPPSFAARGDVAVVDGDDGPALGVVQGEAVYVLRPSGLGLILITKALRAFRV